MRSQRLVLDISRRSSYLEINQIRSFLDHHESAEVTCKELEELGDLERALIQQCKYVCCLVTREGPDALAGSNDLISVLGMEVGDTLRSSKWFLGEAAMAKLNTWHPDLGDSSKAKPANVTDKVEAKLILLKSMDGGEQQMKAPRKF